MAKQVKTLRLNDTVALESDVDSRLHQSAAAPVFDATQDYPAGYHVTRNGYLYRFTSAHAAGAWTGNDVVVENMTTPDAMLDLTSAGFLRVVSADGTILWMQNALSASRNEIAADFSASTAYAPPALVVYNGVLYRCSTAHPAGAWDATHFTAATVQDVLALMNTEIGGKQNALTAQQLANIDAVPGKLDSVISKTHSELLALRDNGNLVPGQQYRVTDYVATTNGDMESRSANHPFDIIVTADDERTLNEHARAIMHETVLDFSFDTQYAVGDFCKYWGSVYKCVTAHKGEWNSDDFTEEFPYFYGCDLAAWDVWYCLDNDTARFAWADDTDGKGVVYRLVDEFLNDSPYDFKGIQFKAYGDTDNVYRYTFDSGDASGNTDLSKSGFENEVYKNTIGQFSNYKWRLNRIVFKGMSCYSNKFGPHCYSDTFGSGCRYNMFGSSCYYNTFGSSCYYNTFGSDCYSNKFGWDCYSNEFSSNCYSNTFGSDCYSNEFSSNCNSNTFSSNCHYNTFGSNCFYNTFGSNCYSNTFGSNCFYNIFGSNCYSNTFGSNCFYNIFGSNCCAGGWSNSTQQYVGSVIQYNNALRTVQKRYRGAFFTSQTYLVGETLYRQAKYWECTTEHSGSWKAEHFTEIQLVGGILSTEEYVPLSYYRYIEFEDGVSYVALDCTATRGNANYQNVTVSKGIAGTESAPKHIEDANYSQTSKTTYQPADSQVISL